MKRSNLFLVSSIFCAILLSTLCFNVSAQEKYAPQNNNGKKWRIGYLEAGDYAFYPEYLRGLAEGLMELGWIEQDYVPKYKKSGDIWNWLSQKSKSDYIDFIQDAYWQSGGDEDAELRKTNKKLLLERLDTQNDLDMIIAMGTRAGQDIVDTDINTMVMEATDALKSGVVKGEEKSGISHLHAKIDKNRYKKQIAFFHREFKFKKLGIVYINSIDGRAFAALDDILSQAKQLGFSVEKCLLPAEADKWPKEKLVKKIVECHEELAPKIDALYMTTAHLVGTREKDMQYMCALLKPMLKFHVPTWSKSSGFEVQYGALMSFNRPDPADVGFFQAKVMAQILSGVAPGDIDQIFDDPKGDTILLNLRTAQLIRYNPSWNVLAAGEKVYEGIKGAANCE